VSGDWKLIYRGFAISAAGAGALMFFIVALSAAYVAKCAVAGVSIVVAGCLALIFRSRIRRYLNALDQRDMELSAQLASLQPEQSSRHDSDLRPTGGPPRFKS
jgi:hypothetical protein